MLLLPCLIFIAKVSLDWLALKLGLQSADLFVVFDLRRLSSVMWRLLDPSAHQ